MNAGVEALEAAAATVLAAPAAAETVVLEAGGLAWCILGLALQGPLQTTEINADRNACFSSRFVIF